MKKAYLLTTVYDSLISVDIESRVKLASNIDEYIALRIRISEESQKTFNRNGVWPATGYTTGPAREEMKKTVDDLFKKEVMKLLQEQWVKNGEYENPVWINNLLSLSETEKEHFLKQHIDIQEDGEELEFFKDLFYYPLCPLSKFQKLLEELHEISLILQSGEKPLPSKYSKGALEFLSNIMMK